METISSLEQSGDQRTKNKIYIKNNWNRIMRIFEKKKRKLEERHFIDFSFCARSFFEIHYKVIRAPTNLSKGKLFTKPSLPCQDRLINFPVHFAVISLRRCPLRVDESLPFFRFSSFLLSFFLNQSALVPTCLTITVDTARSIRPGS